MPPPVPEELSRTLETLYRSESGRVLDVWTLPTPGGHDDFPRLVKLMRSYDAERSSHVVRALFAARWALGRMFGLDGSNVIAPEPEFTSLLFQRRSTLSLSGNFGEVRLGRDFAPSYLNVTGFDVPKLVCGAMGTLCVLTEVTLRVFPKPPLSTSRV